MTTEYAVTKTREIYRAKRIIDVTIAFFGLLALLPVFLVLMAMVYWTDKHSPFYYSKRVGKGGKSFNMIKFRSMSIHSGAVYAHPTTSADPRITPIGRYMRSRKLDELPQLINVLKGEMSLVGPRPQVPEVIASFSPAEMQLLAVTPGITDLASFAFADEERLLGAAADVQQYNRQVLRPCKSGLSQLYSANISFRLDLQIVVLTVFSLVFSRRQALTRLEELLESLNADPELIATACRTGRSQVHSDAGTANVETSPVCATSTGELESAHIRSAVVENVVVTWSFGDPAQTVELTHRVSAIHEQTATASASHVGMHPTSGTPKVLSRYTGNYTTS